MTTTFGSQPVPPAPARPRPGARRLLPRGLRRTVLVVHIVAAGAWVGVDVIVGVLAVSGWVSADPAVQGVAYQALGRFVLVPMLTAALVCLASGLMLGLGTKWGLLRYWWVGVKLVLNLVLCTLIVVLLRPGLADVRAHGEALTEGAPVSGAPGGDLAGLFFPPAVSLTFLTFATVLSVCKPWGRISPLRRHGLGSGVTGYQHEGNRRADEERP